MTDITVFMTNLQESHIHVDHGLSQEDVDFLTDHIGATPGSSVSFTRNLLTSDDFRVRDLYYILAVIRGTTALMRQGTCTPVLSELERLHDHLRTILYLFDDENQT